MDLHNRRKTLAISLLISLILSIGISNAIVIPTSSTSTGTFLGSLNFNNLSGSTIFGIPANTVLAVIISALIAFIIYGALKGTHLSNGAGVIGMLFGAILLVILYLNPKYLALLSSIAFLLGFIVLVLSILVFARKKLSAPGKVVGIILAIILLYTLFASNPSVANYIDNVLGFDISGLMLPILAYMFVIIVIYIIYALTYKRAKSSLSKLVSVIIIIVVAVSLLVPGFLHFLALSGMVFGIIFLALLLLLLIRWLLSHRERVVRIPKKRWLLSHRERVVRIPKKAVRGVQNYPSNKPYPSDKSSVVPASSLKHGKSFFRLGQSGQKGGGFATKSEIEAYKKGNPPPNLYLELPKKGKKK